MDLCQVPSKSKYAMDKRAKEIIRGELIGRLVAVDGTRRGVIVDETKHLLIIEMGQSHRKFIKSCHRFTFWIPEEIILGGRVLVGRPEDRIKSRVQNYEFKKHRV